MKEPSYRDTHSPQRDPEEVLVSGWSESQRYGEVVSFHQFHFPAEVR